MNIFYLDTDIEKCVQYHCDKHVVKMCIEYVQLLSSVHNITETANEYCYKLTHKNHPDAVWARASLANYEYLFSLAVLLGDEYTYRYGKHHASISRLVHFPDPKLPELKFTEPPKCVHDDFKGIDDTVEAYRQYYIRDKGDFCTWKLRDRPYWFKN